MGHFCTYFQHITHSISHELCMFCCGYSISSGFMGCLYPYNSGVFHLCWSYIPSIWVILLSHGFQPKLNTLQWVELFVKCTIETPKVPILIWRGCCWCQIEQHMTAFLDSLPLSSFCFQQNCCCPNEEKTMISMEIKKMIVIAELLENMLCDVVCMLVFTILTCELL